MYRVECSFLLLIPAVGLLLLGACATQGVSIGPDGLLDDGTADDDGDNTTDYPAGPLNPDTFLIEEHPCFQYAEVLVADRSELELGFSCDPHVLGLVPGQIVVGVQDGGYLRRIEAVEVAGQVVFLSTSEASVAEAVTDVVFDETFDLSARETVEFSGRVLDEVEIPEGSASVVVDHGVLNFQSELSASGEFGFLRLKSVTSRNRVHLGIEVETTFHSDGPVERAQTVDLGEYAQPFTFRIGPVRVRGQVESTVRIGFVHNATGPVHVASSFSGSGVVEMGGKYVMPDTWQPHWNPAFEGTVSELVPEGGGDWEGRVFLLIDSKVVLDGVDSGSSRLQMMDQGQVINDCDTRNWTHSGGVEGQSEMKLRFMDRAVDHTFPHLEIEADREEGMLEQTEPAAHCDALDVAGECTPVAEVTCGETIVGDTGLDPGATTAMDGYGCNVGNYEAPELVYSWTATSSDVMTFELLNPIPTELNHDLLILEGTDNMCSSTRCVAYGFSSVEFEPVIGNTYFLVVDGFLQESGAFEAQVSCDGQ